MPVTEDQLQAITLGVQLDHLNPRIHQRRHPPQPKRTALRARALPTQFGVFKHLFPTIRPVQSQLLFAAGIANRQRVHCS
ncbi:hypothetical protein D3C84_1010210 [compost metagenome]